MQHKIPTFRLYFLSVLCLLTAGLFTACDLPGLPNPDAQTSASVPEISLPESSVSEPEPAPAPSSEPSPEPEPSSKPEPSFEPEPSSEPERFAACMPQAREILAEMTLEEKIGQLFLPSYADESAAELIAAYHPAGLLLFAAQIEPYTPDGLRARLAEFNASSKIPLAFAVDEEGGEIVRVSKFPSYRAGRFPSPMTLYQQGGTDALAADAKEKSEFLLDLGLNLNLAPVCDVSADPGSYIYTRTLGTDASRTAEGIRAIVTETEAAGMSCALKHFPGYGGNPDTHTGTSTDPRTYAELSENDFLPFRAGIEAGADFVMFSHNLVPDIDPVYPASLSPEMHRILRDELGFTGLCITDDLAMNAVAEFGVSAALLAFEAGNNVIITHDIAGGTAAIAEALGQGVISKSQLDDAILPTLAWKLEKSILS